MIRKLLFIVCSTIFVNAGILGRDYSPATDVSYSSFSSSPPIPKSIGSGTHIVENTQQVAYEQTELSPIYESIYNTREGKHLTEDGSEHRTFAMSLDTEISKLNRFEPATKSVSFSAPVYTEAIYQPGSYSKPMSPTANYLSFPSNRLSIYATQIKPANYGTPENNPPLSYSISAFPIIYNSKVTPGLAAFASSSTDYAPSSTGYALSSTGYAPSSTSYAPTLIESRSMSTNLLNSETPAVSPGGVTFSGTGYNYSW